MKNKFILTSIILLSLAEGAYCTPVNDVVIKFSLAMIGVVISSIVLYIGLSIYNKIRLSNQEKRTEEELIFSTPKTKEDAIKFFIRKNRLK